MRQRPPLFRPAAVAALLATLALAACGGSRTSEDDGRLQVVVSLPLFADFVHQVAGDRVEVAALLPPSADPHTFEPTPSQIRTIAEADVIFVNDIEPSVEGSILDAIQANKGDGTQVVAFLSRIDISFTEISDNPHLWLDPRLAREYAAVIAETLVGEDADSVAFYGPNLARYSARLFRLDEEFAAAVEMIPPQNRKLVTSHNAFVHFAERYGLDQVGFATPSSAQEPSPRDIQRLVTAIRDEGVPAVFSEPGFRDGILRQVAAEADVQVCVLYSDALDDQVQTYIDMMRFNADELARCLGV